MKLLTYILAFAYPFAWSPANAVLSNQSGIAAIANEKTVLKSDLNYRIKLVAKSSGLEDTPATYAQLKNRVLDQMIDEALQLELLEKIDFVPKQDQVDSAWQRMEKNFGMQEGQLAEFLKKEKIPRRTFEDQIRASLGWNNYIHERYSNVVQVSDADVKNEVKRMQDDKDRDQALLSEIVLRYDSPAQAEACKAKAHEIVNKVRSGAPFPMLAQQFSRAASAASGGDIGWVTVDQLDPQVKNVVKNLNKGDISDPIPVNGGYLVMGMRDRQGVGSLGDPMEYVSFQQVEFTFPLFGGPAAMEETAIQANAIRQQCKTCTMLNKLTKDRPRIKTQTVNRQKVESFHPELRKVIKGLKPGEKSQLLNTGQSLIMFMLCDREIVKPHEPSETDIRLGLTDKKLNLISERELRTLRRSAHVEKKV